MSSVPSDLPAPRDEAPPPPPEESPRLRLARRLLRRAANHYVEALEFTREVNSTPPAHIENLPRVERARWLMLRHQSDAAFDAAEVALATVIANLYDDVAPPGRRVPTRDDDVFVERAIRIDGVTFVVTYDPADYQEETSIIAMLAANHVVDLDD